jgi:hypothetical protein
MRKLCGAIVLVLATSSVAQAQEFRTPDNVTDKKFWLVAGALTTTMLLDTKSTFDVSDRCPACYEVNPVVAPFVRQGATTTFAAGLAFDAGVMTVAAKMKGSDKTWARRTWWIVPAALIAGHSIAFRHNNNLAR